MHSNCPIEVIDLLREREVEFMRVWQCEQEIRQLLGVEDFPFAEPPDLPSRRKVAKGAARTAAPKKEKESSVNSAENSVARLEQGENAYRLVFIYNGKEDCSFQTDRELVRNLLSINSSEFVMEAVEAVSFVDMEHWEIKRQIWSRKNEG
ncbi:MAG: hypothetical protein IJS15_16300 [Victivallales bacterium]|nr:hypothetical protein [Victivallales bacterium]